MVLIEDIKPGQKITGIVRRDDDGETFVKPCKTVTVKQVEPCPGQWRTHLHINRMDCWDGRTEVQIG